MNIKLFELELISDKRHLEMYGDYNKDTYELTHICLYERKHDNLKKLKITNEMFLEGIQTNKDVYYEIIDAIIRKQNNLFKVIYMDSMIVALTNKFSNNIAITIKEREIPKIICKSKNDIIYTLSLVTDKFTYYKDKNENIIMLETITGKIISDSEDAKEQFLKSIQETKNGIDELYYKNFSY